MTKLKVTREYKTLKGGESVTETHGAVVYAFAGVSPEDLEKEAEEGWQVVSVGWKNEQMAGVLLSRQITVPEKEK